MAVAAARAHRCIVAIAAASACACAFADGNGDDRRVVLHVEPQASRYDAVERLADGRVFNRERGTLLGLRLAIEAPLLDVATWRLAWLHAAAPIAYEGQTQLGLPLVTTTDLRIDELTVDAWSTPRGLIGNVEWRGHAGLALRRIDRAVRAGALSSRATETMDATSVQLGVQLSQALDASWSAMLDASIAAPIAQRLALDTFGVFDETRLEPSRRLAWRVEPRLRWQATASSAVELQAHVQSIRFGPAPDRVATRNGFPSAVVGYPGSRQRLRGAGLEWSKRW